MSSATGCVGRENALPTRATRPMVAAASTTPSRLLPSRFTTGLLSQVSLRTDTPCNGSCGRTTPAPAPSIAEREAVAARVGARVQERRVRVEDDHRGTPDVRPPRLRLVHPLADDLELV